MGCDGGTIPRRDELVRVKKKPEQKDKESELSFRWRHCAITQQPLQPPIVACGLGRLYCKESVLEGLLDRTKLPDLASHITSLKDVRELVLTPNPAYAKDSRGEKGESGRYVDHRASPYVCPVIGLELSGMFRFAFSWSCGCVVSEKALKAVPSKLCHKCQKPVTPEDFVFLNAEGEVLEKMQARLDERRTLAKANKKNKKQKNIAAATVTSASESSLSPGTEKTIDIPSEINKEVEKSDISQEEKPEIPEPASNSVESVEKTPQDPAVQSKEKVIIKEESLETKERGSEDRKGSKRSHSPHRSRHDQKDKRDKDSRHHRDHKDDRRSSKDHTSRDHKTSRDDHKSSKDRRHKDHKAGKIESISDPAYKKAKSEYSVADDPRASKVYKSLFTSHNNAKNQTKAHWVTYNPFYN